MGRIPRRNFPEFLPPGGRLLKAGYFAAGLA